MNDHIVIQLKRLWALAHSHITPNGCFDCSLPSKQVRHCSTELLDKLIAEGESIKDINIYTSLLFVIPLNIISFPPPITFRSLREASVNLHGLKNNLTRLALFHKLKSTRYNVIYLQQTHTTLHTSDLKWVELLE